MLSCGVIQYITAICTVGCVSYTVYLCIVIQTELCSLRVDQRSRWQYICKTIQNCLKISTPLCATLGWLHIYIPRVCDTGWLGVKLAAFCGLTKVTKGSLSFSELHMKTFRSVLCKIFKLVGFYSSEDVLAGQELNLCQFHTFVFLFAL